MRKLPILLFVIMSITVKFSFAQKEGQELVDSLLSELSKAKEDTGKVNILTSVGWAIIRLNEYDKSATYANDALILAQKLNFKKGQTSAYHLLGNVFASKGDFLSALDNYYKAVKLLEEAGNKKGMASIYNNIGLVYQHQGNLPESLKNLLVALRLNEETGNKQGIAGNCNNIGIIYLNQKSYQEAIKKFTDANKIFSELGDRFSMNHPYNNMGNIYLEQGKYPEAFENFSAALRIREEMGNKYLIADSYANIGLVYEKQKKYADALDRYLTTLKLKQEIGDKDGISTAYFFIGGIKYLMKNFSEARHYYNIGLAIKKEVGSIDGIKNGYEYISELDSAVGDYKSSLANYKMYILYRDSLFNEENTKKMVAGQMQYDFDKKEAATKAEQEKKDVLTAANIKRQRTLRNAFIAGFAFMLLFAGIFFMQRNKIKKGKKRSDELLLNILPSETAEELKATGTAEAKDFDEVTVLFTDFKDFTQASEKMLAHEVVNEIHYYFSEFDRIISKYNIEKIKTIGDSYMAAGGLPVANKTNP